MANLEIAFALARLDTLNLEFDMELVRYALAVEEQENNRRRARRRKWWMKPWLRRRTSLGQYTRLMEELRAEDIPSYTNYMRMPLELVDEILQRIPDRAHDRKENHILEEASITRVEICHNSSLPGIWR